MSTGEISTIVCDTVQRAAALLNKATSIPSLKVIVLVEDITKELQDVAEAAGVTLVRFSDVEVEFCNSFKRSLTFDFAVELQPIEQLPNKHVMLSQRGAFPLLQD